MKRATAWVRATDWSARRNHYRITMLWVAMVSTQTAAMTYPTWRT